VNLNIWFWKLECATYSLSKIFCVTVGLMEIVLEKSIRYKLFELTAIFQVGHVSSNIQILLFWPKKYLLQTYFYFEFLNIWYYIIVLLLFASLSLNLPTQCLHAWIYMKNTCSYHRSNNGWSLGLEVETLKA
jgi:hypothetical protein